MASGLMPELASALGWFQRSSIALQISRLHQELPATSCARQGHCCSLLPPGQPVEIIAWFAWFLEQPPERRAQEAARLLEHFLTNALRRNRCPWSLPQSCAIYERRFFGCRAYGLWSASLYASRRQAALAAQEGVAQAWSGLGVSLPAEVLAPGPGYCGQVRQLDGDKVPIGDDRLMELEKKFAALAPPSPWLQACGGDLAYALARLALGEGQCLGLKVGITRDWLGGRQTKAERQLRTALRSARSWALDPNLEHAT